MSPAIASLGMVIGLWACLALLCCGSGSPSGRESNKVTYDVVGESTRMASLTYTNQGGGTEQQEVMLPWSKSFQAQYGDHLYISAQNKKEYGSITVYISINGNTRKTSTSSGGYVIASASEQCCP